MENLLIKYFEARIKNENHTKEPGPVITISREYGCPSKILAGILVEKLSMPEPGTIIHPPPWKWIGRELLEEAAKDLKVDPRHINHIFDYHERSIIDDILAATRKDGSYKSDVTIKRSVGKVIRSIGERGQVIIVGRAGVALTREIKRSFHVRLMAPMDWRINRLMVTENLSKDGAIEMISIKDANRKKFLEYYLGQKFQIEIFDVVYNCGFLSLTEIADSIIHICRQRKVL
ncbi:MAG: cytidylate kinase-like family protein [Bacteroidales bacterium]|jgi:cytidylate kinase